MTQALQKVLEILKQKGCQVFLFQNSDPHLDEYIPDHWKFIKYLTGFSGSVATLVLTQNHMGLWTDGRYFLMAEKQLQNSGVVLHRMTTRKPEYIDWIIENLQDLSTIGLDTNIISYAELRMLENKARDKMIKLKFEDLGDLNIWPDRPDLPDDMVFFHPLEFAGENSTEKLRRIRVEMEKNRVTHHLIASPDDIAWILNLRGKDISYNPVFLSYLVIGKEQSMLFISEDKICSEIADYLIFLKIEVHPYGSIYNYLANLSPGSTVWLNPSKISYALVKSISLKVNTIEWLNAPERMKAIKNQSELESLKRAFQIEGLAWIKILYEIRFTGRKIDEFEITQKIKRYFAEARDYLDLSFSTIVGYRQNAAVIHYEPIYNDCLTLGKEGILLIDAGAHYFNGTTDTTRTITLGDPTETEIFHYTLVLKSHIALATSVFPRGTKGIQLDMIARRVLWNYKLNYNHGTGHGIGFCLNVHEGPLAIGQALIDVAIEPGMVVSCEPGLYIENQYGIRLENTLVCVADSSDPDLWLKFDTVTSVPFCRELINPQLLSNDEKKWFNNYQQMVYDILSLNLPEIVKEWLYEETRPFE